MGSSIFGSSPAFVFNFVEGVNVEVGQLGEGDVVREWTEILLLVHARAAIDAGELWEPLM